MKLKNKKTILILFLLLTIIIVMYFLFSPSITFLEKDVVLEKGIAYKAEDYVLKSKVKLILDSSYLDTDTVGKKSYYFKVRKWIFEKEYRFRYEVIDTIAPRIEIKQNTIYIEPKQDYTEEDMKKNINIDEGELTFIYAFDNNISGSYIINVIATDEVGNKSDASYELFVKDIEAPFIFKSGDGAKILKGSIFDIDSIISYGDNCDPKPSLKLEGYVNTSRIGYYPLRATLLDFSNNETQWDFTVQVVYKEDYPDYEYDSYSFDDFIKDYKAPGRKLGIDVSEWQDRIDFEAIKNAGCEFIIIRMGFSHQGVLTLDKEFKYNLQQAKKVGIPVGVYLFCYDDNQEDLSSTINSMFEQLDGVSLELPIVFDWENFSKYQKYEMSFQQLNSLYDYFEKQITQRGYQSMLYGSKYYLQHIWTNTENRDIWLAQYIDWPTYDKQYQIWQLIDTGVIDGIDAYVDFDIWFD